MFIVLESEIYTLFLSQNYGSTISRQLLNSSKTLTILSILWSSAPLTHSHIVKNGIRGICLLVWCFTPVLTVSHSFHGIFLVKLRVLLGHLSWHKRVSHNDNHDILGKDRKPLLAFLKSLYDLADDRTRYLSKSEAYALLLHHPGGSFCNIERHTKLVSSHDHHFV